MGVDFVVAVEQQDNDTELETLKFKPAELETAYQMMVLLTRLKPGRRRVAISWAMRFLNQME